MSEEHSAPGMPMEGSPVMDAAYQKARDSFKHFWRELSWERRRIIPAFEMMLIKLPFSDGKRTDDNPEIEHMWLDDVNFDGEMLAGTLMNSPNWLVSVKAGQEVESPFSQLEDWLMVSDGKAYGAFTVNVMRSMMSPSDRKAHDKAWGLDFGDPDVVRIDPREEPKGGKGILGRIFGGQKKTSASSVSTEGFQDHPMCVNMLPKIEEQLKAEPDLVQWEDERGWTMLHSEALAGNLGAVKLLVKHGADPEAKTPQGKNAAALARCLGWEEIAVFLENSSKD